LIKKQTDYEDQILQLIDMGAEDVEEDEELIEVYTLPDSLTQVKEKAIKAGFSIKEAVLSFKPKTIILIEDEDKKKKLLAFLEGLEDLDDVQKVYCNADFKTS